MSTPSQGSQFSDGIRVGSYRDKVFSYGSPGAALSSVMFYAIKPEAAFNICGAAIPVGGGFIPIQRTDGVPNITYEGYSNVLPMKCARGLSFASSSLPGPSLTVTISGWDIWGQKVVEVLTINAQATVFNTTKTFLYLKSVYVSGASDNFTGLASSVYGFPYYVSDISAVRIMAGGHPDYFIPYGGTIGNYPIQTITFPDAFNGGGYQVGDQTFPATATTGDPRGFYMPSDTPDGAKWVTFKIYVPAFDPSNGRVTAPTPLDGDGNPQPVYQNQVNIYGVTQYAEGWQ